MRRWQRCAVCVCVFVIGVIRGVFCCSSGSFVVCFAVQVGGDGMAFSVNIILEDIKQHAVIIFFKS